jgi:hypothetical protein
MSLRFVCFIDVAFFWLKVELPVFRLLTSSARLSDDGLKNFLLPYMDRKCNDDCYIFVLGGAILNTLHFLLYRVFVGI